MYDALVTKRIYKEKLTHDEAKLIIIEGSGKQFDPDIVKIFVKFESRFYQTTQELSK